MESATEDSVHEDGRRMALVEVSPELLLRLRDPRVVLALVAGIAGAVALTLGYFGVSGTLDPGKQLPYLISGGAGGLFLLGLGAALLFSADMAEARVDARRTRDEVAALKESVDRLSEMVAQIGAGLAEAPRDRAGRETTRRR